MSLYVGKDVAGKLATLLGLTVRKKTGVEFPLTESIQPMVDTTDILKDWKLLHQNKDLSGADPVYWYYVPEGIKRTVKAYHRDASTGVTFVSIRTPEGKEIRLSASSANHSFGILDIVMYPGWYWRFGGCNNGADTSHALGVLCFDEEVY